MVTILFFVHTITEAKQYAGLGRAEPGLELGLEPWRWIFQPGHDQPGHLTWRALV